MFTIMRILGYISVIFGLYAVISGAIIVLRDHDTDKLTRAVWGGFVALIGAVMIVAEKIIPELAGNTEINPAVILVVVCAVPLILAAIIDANDH